MALDPTIPRWPTQLSPRDFTDPQLVNATMESPTPIVGAPQAILSDAGMWSFQYSGIPIYTRSGKDLLAIWRSVFTGRLQQGLPIYMPFRDWARGPVSRGNLAVDPVLVPYYGGTTFSDTTEFSSDYEDAKIAVAASQYATSISVDVDSTIVSAGGTPQGGDFVSIDGRAHLITGAWPDASVTNRWTWAIMPPLRAAAAVGAIIEIRDPVCQMVLAGEDRRKLQLARDLGQVAHASVTFIEDRW